MQDQECMLVSFTTLKLRYMPKSIKIGCKLGCLLVAGMPSKLTSPLSWHRQSKKFMLLGKFIIAFFETMNTLIASNRRSIRTVSIELTPKLSSPKKQKGTKSFQIAIIKILDFTIFLSSKKESIKPKSWNCNYKMQNSEEKTMAMDDWSSELVV